MRRVAIVRNDRVSRSSGISHEVPAVGARVGAARYILKRKVGQGECTEVWLARDAKLEREVALKFIPIALVQDPHTLERLEEATRRSAQLAHRAIARVYELVLDNQIAAIATEYVDGWPLTALKTDRPRERFRIEEILPWVRQLCAALEYAHHEFCLVHRDLKLSNLLVDGRDQLKVTDFGIDNAVRLMAGERSKVTSGTIAYMSPQQIQGAEASVLDDVYALGASIYELLTGTPPFYTGDVLAQIRELPAATMKERLAELGIKDSIPIAWEKTVAACLAKDPGKRPGSANEVLCSLEKGIESRLIRSLGPLPIHPNGGAQRQHQSL
jgi:serine/threonine protein kinase